ncbi:MAG: hypothetical protein J07HR59_01779 [Halorubrum sp. J07HR59]|nr:MAG: hypothetical protein J07HR59_01779 [Halorubrum sp. J07HR59]
MTRVRSVGLTRSIQPLHPSARQTHTVSTGVVPVAPSEETDCLSETSLTDVVRSTLTNPGTKSSDDTTRETSVVLLFTATIRPNRPVLSHAGSFLSSSVSC